MTIEELKNKLISEAQVCWNKLNITELAELKVQVEKMKCCENCKKFVLGKTCKTPCIKYDKWEIKEK